MALDLFANYERSSNNTLFYRAVSSVPHDVIFKLVDQENPELKLIDWYQAEFSINNSARRPMIDLQTCQQFQRTAECLSSITVFVSSLNPIEYYGTFTLSAQYVSSFPSADFVAYPTLRINEYNGTLTTLDSTNYTQSSGVYFYGEGHTETINLSSNYSTANWFVGNSLSSIEGGSSNTVVSTVTNRTATVSITSSPALEKQYPISLWTTDSKIKLTGPIYTYDDLTGLISFYPFFCSTFHITGSASELNGRLRNFIDVRPYPIVENYDIVSQLSAYPTSLPYDFTPTRFLATVQSNNNQSAFLTESFYATRWKLESVADTQEPNPDWENTTTIFGGVTGYSFPLSYYNQNNINDFLFKCSAGFDTTVTTTVSVYKSTEINLPPNDWLCRTVPLVLTESNVVAGMPIGRFYTSSYYYLTGEEIKFYNIAEDRFNITVTSVVLSSERLEEPLVFSASEVCSPGSNTLCFKTASYEDVGTVTMSATINFTDQDNQARSVTTILKDFIEIVPYYDQVSESSYRSVDSSPSVLTEDYAPRLSPNEWVTEDNINSIFVKFNDTVEELRSYARIYNTTNKINGRLEPTPAPEGSCLGKYCFDWKWAARKCGSSTTYTTWQNTKCDQEYAVTWAGEDCSLVDELGCGRNDYWHVPTIEPLEFNVWNCIQEDETCKYTGIARLNNLDMLVLAYKSELHLLNNDYYATLLNKHFFADKVFKFINIAGIATTSDDKIAVLDSTLSRVSVFSIDVTTNDFVLFSTWGRYGLSNSKTGFNKPTDIHIDKYNNVWVCDAGNECVKKLTINGRHIATFQSTKFQDNPPISICVDSNDNLHCLAEDSKVYVFDKDANFAFQYSLPEGITGTKINSNFNDETIYITYDKGILKYFRTGVFSHYIINDYPCVDDSVLNKFSSIVQDKNRNIYVTLNNTILKIIDRMTIDELSYENYSTFNLWSLDSILIDKEEYIQPWVYLKSFHRLWDNIELFRNSLFYEIQGCKSYAEPTYVKEDLKLGQNEIVTNAVINRLSEQLWTNLKSVAKYFDPTCKN